jgi:hypothetical protein
MRTIRLAIIGLTTLVIAGCNSAPPASVPAPPPGTAAELAEVTFYLPNMNKGLKIL